MQENDKSFKRWYDEDDIVAKCVCTLENLHDSLKRQTATYLMDEIINKPPYNEMLADSVFNLATSEDKRRRWYDFDEVVRIFVELLRHSSPEIRREISITAIKFIEDLILDRSKSVEIELPESEKYLNIKLPE